MSDLFFIALILFFSLASRWLIGACERLRG